jgi:hypothetical protein
MHVCCHADFEPTEHKLLNLGQLFISEN